MDKIKVTAFIGSPKKSSSSNTYLLCNEILKKAAEKDKRISFEIFCAGDYKINYCSGCGCCIRTHKCSLDKNDDIGFFKKKIKEADIIVWGSPVYTYSVSGIMKSFMDRLCCLYHNMPMVGKLGISIATTGIDGLEQVHNLNEALLGALGIPIISKTGLQQYKLEHDADAVSKAIEKSAGEIINALNGKFTQKSLQTMETIYKIMSSRISSIKQVLPPDIDLSTLEYNSFTEAYNTLTKFVKIQ